MVYGSYKGWQVKRYRGIVQAADGFMTRWHRAEAEKNAGLRYANEDAKEKGEKEKGQQGRERGAGEAVLTPLSI